MTACQCPLMAQRKQAKEELEEIQRLLASGGEHERRE